MVAPADNNSPLHSRNLEKKFGVWYAEQQRKVSQGLDSGHTCQRWGLRSAWPLGRSLRLLLLSACCTLSATVMMPSAQVG